MYTAVVGIVASRDRIIYEYFTSSLFPLAVSDELAVAEVEPNRGDLWGLADEGISLGVAPLAASLVATIVYQNYNNPLWNDGLMVVPPVPQAAALVTTIAYVDYNNPLHVDAVGVQVPQPLAGSLQVTISYISYNNPSAADGLSVALPQVISGTLS